MAVIGGRAHPRLGLAMAAVAWVLGLSRMAAGLHYPSDVLAGAMVGSAVGIGFARISLVDAALPGGQTGARKKTTMEDLVHAMRHDTPFFSGLTTYRLDLVPALFDFQKRHAEAGSRA